MSLRPAIFDFASYLDSFFKLMEYPQLYLEVLSAENPSMAIVQTASPVVEKEYINGSRTYRLEAELLYQDILEHQMEVRERMTDVAMYLNDCKNVEISEGREVLRVSATAPSIREITEGNILKMGISLVVIYRED